MNSVRRGVGATVVVKDGQDKTKYVIENDGIINVVTASGAVFKEVRCTGTSQDGSCLRFVDDNGTSEVPMNIIKEIQDCHKQSYSVVTVS